MIRCIFAGHRDVCGVRVEDITEVLEEINNMRNRR